MAVTEPCARCGDPATGYAFINDRRYCHGDEDERPTCYERGQWDRYERRSWDLRGNA